MSHSCKCPEHEEIRAAERKRIADLVSDMTDHEVVFVDDIIALIEGTE